MRRSRFWVVVVSAALGASSVMAAEFAPTSLAAPGYAKSAAKIITVGLKKKKKAKPKHFAPGSYESGVVIH